MSTSSRFYPNLYKDSVSLMAVTVQVTSVPGIESASVVMASATNVETSRRPDSGRSTSGPTTSSSPSPVRPRRGSPRPGRQTSVEAPGGGAEESSAAAPTTNIQMAVTKDPELDLALISVRATTRPPKR